MTTLNLPLAIWKRKLISKESSYQVAIRIMTIAWSRMMSSLTLPRKSRRLDKIIESKTSPTMSWTTKMKTDQSTVWRRQEKEDWLKLLKGLTIATAKQLTRVSATRLVWAKRQALKSFKVRTRKLAKTQLRACWGFKLLAKRSFPQCTRVKLILRLS